MVALSSPRRTQAVGGLRLSRVRVPLKAAATIHPGGLVGIDAAGWGVPAGPGAVRVIGVFNDGRDSVTNSGANGAKVIEVDRHQGHTFANDGTITQAHLLATCYAKDDQTLSANDAAGTLPKVGTVGEVNAEGVTVWFESTV